MGNGLVIADSGPIFSLVLIDRLDILDALFDNIRIPQAVWNEITNDKTKQDYQSLNNFFKDKICKISGFIQLNCSMQYYFLNSSHPK